MEKVLEVHNLFRNGILNNVSFDVKKGELLAIMGPSGSGKSTLLYHVSGLEHIEGGMVVLDGTNIGEMTEDELADFRLTKTGFIFQQMNMMEGLDLLDNILLPAYHACRTKTEKRQKRERALALMKKMQIDFLAHREISKVSGGQLQRACICRSMMLEPEIIFADEPTGALNQNAATEVIEAFMKINSEGTTILMVTHDSRIAAMCERILYLLDGRIKGELDLGKNTRSDSRDREQKVIRWLTEMGW